MIRPAHLLGKGVWANETARANLEMELRAAFDELRDNMVSGAGDCWCERPVFGTAQDGNQAERKTFPMWCIVELPVSKILDLLFGALGYRSVIV